MRRLGLILMLLCVAGAAWSQGAKAVREQAEASLLVQGSIEITTEGAVAGYVLDDAEALSEGMRGVVDATVRQWRFEPVRRDGEPVHVRARMTLRAVARNAASGDLEVRIAGASFQDEAARAAGQYKRLRPPSYPMELARKGVSGTVYLVPRLSADGRVEEGVAEQVNLMTSGSERDMAIWRERLADASIRAARRWEFSPAASSDGGEPDGRSVRVPVDFVVSPLRVAKPGQWQLYLPGPRQPIPWYIDQDSNGGSPDAVASDIVQPLDGSGPRLLSALGASPG